jgi:hypothetical protein
MKTFNDNSGRTWSVSLNVDAIKRVRTLVDVDLMQAVGGKLLERLTTDPVLLCDVLYAVCKVEADAKNVTDEEFGRALAGDAIDAATTALLEELVDFFPQAKRRVLGKAMGKLKTLQARALEVAEMKLDSADLDAAMEKALGDCGNSYGNSPVSPESTPAR